MTAKEIYVLLKHDEAFLHSITTNILDLAAVLRAHGLFVSLDETWRLFDELGYIHHNRNEAAKWAARS